MCRYIFSVSVTHNLYVKLLQVESQISVKKKKETKKNLIALLSVFCKRI